MNTERSTEILFLKIFKFAILALMSLALIITTGSLLYAAIEYFQEPKEPAPAKTAPAESVNIDEFLKALQESQKTKETPKGKREENQSSTDSQEQPKTKNYENEAKELFSCLKEFDANVKRSSNIEEEDIRQWLQKNADDPRKERGQPWVKDSVKFNCAALSNQQVIEYSSKNQSINTINVSALFHLKRWDEIREGISQFNLKEEQRILSERDAEERRIVLAKAKALSLLIVAGSSFGVFMLFALYLIASAIESNLRNINQSIKAIKSGGSNEEITPE